MRQVKFSFLIHQSINRTELVLLKPFAFRKWLRLVFIAFLAGSLTSGGFHFNVFGPSYHTPTKASAIKTSSIKVISSSANGVTKTVTSSRQTVVSGLSPFFNPVIWIEQLRPQVWGLVCFAGFLLVGIMVVFMWLGARFEFVWWEAIVKNTDTISEPFKRYKKQGESLFNLNLIVSVVFLLIGGGIAWLVISMITKGSFKFNFMPDFMTVLSLGVSFALLVVIFLIVSCIFACIIYPQIVTLMAMDNCSFIKAWGKFWEIYSNNAKDIWLFIFLSFGISIVVGIAAGIFAVITVIVLGLTGFIIAVPFALLFWKFKTLLWLIAIILGIPYFLVSVVVLMLLYLPVAVFFRSLSLYFLTSLNCGYEPLPLSTTGGVM